MGIMSADGNGEGISRIFIHCSRRGVGRAFWRVINSRVRSMMINL